MFYGIILGENSWLMAELTNSKFTEICSQIWNFNKINSGSRDRWDDGVFIAPFARQLFPLRCLRN